MTTWRIKGGIAASDYMNTPGSPLVELVEIVFRVGEAA